MCPNIQKENSPIVGKNEQNRTLYNCSLTEHKTLRCKSATKYFKCNIYGYIFRNCSKQKKVINVIVEENRKKTVLINDVQICCLIGNGPDVCIINETVHEKNFKDYALNYVLTLTRKQSFVLFGTFGIAVGNANVCFISILLVLVVLGRINVASGLTIN